ncbi:TRAP transporter permease [Glycomyces sp. L485]|uniref:TRAP transporter permease n=1 Tax=Glycomyces sp. L485 TaxID=2909235 RepID=UPI001F4B26B6|nr:TRAP transporter permease [Glycomyces sp. L485]MCH7231951.1 TRAP transporter permease [Glycomyces sp. L485]
MSAEPSRSDTAVAYDADQAAADIKAMTEAEPITTLVGPVRTEQLHPAWKWVVGAIALSMSIFHLYTAWQGILPTPRQPVVHLMFGLSLIFLTYNTKRHLEKEKRNGLIWTGVGVALLGYLYAVGVTDPAIILPSVLILVLLQITRYIKLTVGGMPLPDLALAGLGVWANWWVIANAGEFSRYVGGDFPAVGIAAATIGTLLVLVAATRAVGMALTVVCVVMISYMLYGSYMPGFLNFGGLDPDRILSDAFLGTKGIFGIPLGVSSTFIFLFMIFAALLQRTGMERFFTNLALGLAGGRVGGTAKVGVITSVFSGTITGSSVANTVSNGAFTIPMMKRAGYKREFAGAVEAASSTGGQIMPPVMGAAAFIMLETIGRGLTYGQIMMAALIPAALFFISQYIVVHFVSKRDGILGLPKDQLPKLGPLMLRRGYLLIPLVVIFVVLSAGITPMTAAFYAVLATVGLNVLVQLGHLAFKGVDGWKRMEDKLTPRTLIGALIDAAKMSLPIVAATAAAGIISGAINNTGLGLKIAEGLIDLGTTISQFLPFENSELYMVMFFTMIACLILGIGIPTTANYVVMSVVAAPAIVGLINGTYTEMGLPEATEGLPADYRYILIAHMFVLYFGVLADITPPVCLAAFAASGISGGNPIKTGVQSVRLAISGFIVPYAFVLAPELLMLGDDWTRIALAGFSALLGAFMLGGAVAGQLQSRLYWWERVGLFVAALLMLDSGLPTDLAGLVLGGLVLFLQYRRRGGEPTPSPVGTTEPAAESE